MRLRHAVLVMIVATGTLAGAQVPEVKLPASPRGTAAVQVGGSWSGTDPNRRFTGGSWITVDYGRPIMRRRDDIFGAGETYGKVVNPDAAIWRAGANMSTRLTTQVPLEIGGRTIAPGVYNVLVDLKERAWTFVLSTQPIQVDYDPNDKVRLFGAYNYDPKFDVLRAPMRVSTSPMSIEQFTIGFADVAADRGALYMAWDRTMAAVDFRVRN